VISDVNDVKKYNKGTYVVDIVSQLFEYREMAWLRRSPEADVSKFICDWVKLVHMCKDAHSQIFNIITKGQSGTLNRSIEESFTIPLKPFESLEELKDFVYRWLRFAKIPPKE
ncbi:729_t:CDS:2, partial [Paraglomus brasilianum]